MIGGGRFCSACDDDVPVLLSAFGFGSAALAKFEEGGTIFRGQGGTFLNSHTETIARHSQWRAALKSFPRQAAPDEVIQPTASGKFHGISSALRLTCWPRSVKLGYPQVQCQPLFSHSVRQSTCQQGRFKPRGMDPPSELINRAKIVISWAGHCSPLQTCSYHSLRSSGRESD